MWLSSSVVSLSYELIFFLQPLSSNLPYLQPNPRNHNPPGPVFPLSRLSRHNPHTRRIRNLAIQIPLFPDLQSRYLGLGQIDASLPDFQSLVITYAHETKGVGIIGV